MPKKEKDWWTIHMRNSKWVYLAVKRQRKDMRRWTDVRPLADKDLDGYRDFKTRKKYYFDAQAAKHGIEFFEKNCHHWEGEWAGELLVLERWQRFVVVCVFGWKCRDGTRRFRIAYEEIARKNGKSTKAGGIGLKLLVDDDEPGAQVYSTATKRDQAKLVFTMAKMMAKMSPQLKQRLDILTNNLSYPAYNAKFEPLGADSDTLDGLNPHGNIVDEVHAHKNRGVWDVMISAQASRRQPLNFVITTAGIYNPNSIGWELHDRAIRVLEGRKDDTFFAFVAAAEKDDDWTDPDVWAKANPNLGVSVKLQYLKDEFEDAKKSPAFVNSFLRYHLNIWVQQRDRYIDMLIYDACVEALGEPELAELLHEPCYGGLDIGTSDDLSAYIELFPPQDEDQAWEVLADFWMPEDYIAAREEEHRVPYGAWIREGLIKVTPGNITDHDFIRAEILEKAEEHELLGLGADPFKAQQLIVQLVGDGLPAEIFYPSFRNFNGPTEYLLDLLRSKQIRIGSNPVLRWMADNMVVRTNSDGHFRPDKAVAIGKIDGMVALIMALGLAMVSEDESNVYEERGFQTMRVA